MSTTNLLTARQFLALFEQKDGLSDLYHTGAVIQNDVHIDGKRIKFPETKESTDRPALQSISLNKLTFTGSVTVENFDMLSFSAQNCHFLQWLSMHSCTGCWCSVHSCKLPRFDGFGNFLEGLSLKEIKRPNEDEHRDDPTIDISGFTLSKTLCLEKVTAKNLKLGSDHGSERLKAPYAETDSELWAFQLQMLGIPVVISTEVASRMLKEGSYAMQLQRRA